MEKEIKNFVVRALIAVDDETHTHEVYASNGVENIEIARFDIDYGDGIVFDKNRDVFARTEGFVDDEDALFDWVCDVFESNIDKF